MTGLSVSPFIEEWLDAITQNFEFVQTFEQPSNATPKKRAAKFEYRHSMTTPPPSTLSGQSRRRPASPTKWQRFESEDGNNGEIGWLEGNDDQTPRSNVSQRLPNTNAPPIPFRGFSVPSITPSQSPSLVSGSSNQSPSVAGSERSQARSGRTKSPVKSANSLWALDLPVIYTPMGDDAVQMLPGDVKDLFRSIEEITMDHLEVIPSEIRKDVEAIIPRAARKDDWFRNAQKSPAAHHETPEDETTYPRSHKPQSPLDISLHELDLLRDIGNKSKNCEIRACAEVTWNMLVHQPLFEHALAGHATVQAEPALTAKIMAPFSPATSGRGGGRVIENKMVDFCFTLWLNEGKPRQLEGDDSASSTDASLMSAIANRVWAQPPDAQSVNQTGYPPLQFAPIACNIETKTSTAQQGGQLQLSVWTAAWYQRILKLVPDGVAQHGIITLPLLHIVGHDWRLSFACWRRDRIEIVGELALGDTRTLLGLYTLVAVVRKIGDWVATDYRRWIEKVFLE
ncbi:hypothetical protein G7Z17_g4100 [Cylindrodendrum hubeiense]|uniref:PD-(D/E)XK nuclease-like domain-containing protein n=1 Tax=Cylindrodendrum hubeiense TaxID=595255 RepID=A0A9P5HEL8_9HYPO|nr:hypothetical protein G7Z17_g4100 [Cylindrodendrum hubeiense]